jgi:hypothetical protein
MTVENLESGRPSGPPEQVGHAFGGSNPSVSPDARHVVYRAADGGLILMNADGGEARRLAPPAAQF